MALSTLLGDISLDARTGRLALQAVTGSVFERDLLPANSSSLR